MNNTLRWSPRLLGLALVVALVAIPWLVAPPANGKRRRRVKRGSVSGMVVVKSVLRRRDPLRTKAYWRFPVGGLQENVKHVPWGELVVFVNLWEKDGAPTKGAKPTMPGFDIRGAVFEPPLIVRPAVGGAATLNIRNFDRFRHRLNSPDNGALNNISLDHEGRHVARLTGLRVPSDAQRPFQRLHLRSKDLRHLRGEVVFLRATHFAVVRGHVRYGSFELTKVPRGKQSLWVYHRGQIVLRQPLEVKRRTTVKLTIPRLR